MRNKDAFIVLQDVFIASKTSHLGMYNVYTHEDLVGYLLLQILTLKGNHIPLPAEANLPTYMYKWLMDMGMYFLSFNTAHILCIIL